MSANRILLYYASIGKPIVYSYGEGRGVRVVAHQYARLEKCDKSFISSGLQETIVYNIQDSLVA